MPGFGIKIDHTLKPNMLNVITQFELHTEHTASLTKGRASAMNVCRLSHHSFSSGIVSSLVGGSGCLRSVSF